MARSSKATGGGGRIERSPPAYRPSMGAEPRKRRPGTPPFKEEEERETPTLMSRLREGGGNFLFDFMAAVIVLLIIIGGLYTYTGNWPPLVVVQSGSMEHSDEFSSIGVIDTGDLVFVKDTGDRPIVPYYEGLQKGHRSYSSYGDVIIFKPNGNDERTAIIHRAVLYIEFNRTDYDPGNHTGGSYDVPSMGLHAQKGMLTIPDYEWPAVRDIRIDLRSILNSFHNNLLPPNSGYITKGDDNLEIDQTSTFDLNDPWLQPVKKEWVIGKSVGELPWFGIIKLWMEGKTDWHPNSQKNMVIALIIIVLSPFVVDFAIYLFTKAVRKDESDPADPVRGRRAVENEKVPRRPVPKRARPGPKRPPFK
ncbi:MAG: S26 family signal peptidase [Thermoplasmatota archaeon]